MAVRASPPPTWRERQASARPVVKGLADQGVLEAVRVPADAPYPTLATEQGQHLNEDQRAAAEALCADVAAGGFAATLLFGVTGSGKTEVYLEAVAECLARGRQALVLLPEVALTSAFLDRVEKRFGARPAEWHHGVTGNERRRCWHGAADGSAQLVVGARSALFLPYANLGLIVIDEEHEGSYKQEEQVFYSARDMAVLRASVEGATAVLATATPSLETWANAEAGKYKRLDLPDRFGAAILPEIELVDLRQNNPGRNRWIASPLVRAARGRLEAGEQVMFFLNRRGYAPLTLCRACGHHFGCPHCDSWLVTHRFRQELLCHQCGHTEKVPSACPACGKDEALAIVGPGVERLAEEAAAVFPGARIEVLSSDLMQGPGHLKERLAVIAEGGADIIIGTQMIAKGHNFPKLTLVGAIDADMGLQGGDLRAAEKTYQILHQVAGRAGRADRRGRAMIQTVSPDHAVLRAIVSGDSEAFWREEAEVRHEAGMPPYGRLGRDHRQRPGRAARLGHGPRAGHAGAGPEPGPHRAFRPGPRAVSGGCAARPGSGCWPRPPRVSPCRRRWRSGAPRSRCRRT